MLSFGQRINGVGPAADGKRVDKLGGHVIPWFCNITERRNRGRKLNDTKPVFCCEWFRVRSLRHKAGAKLTGEGFAG